MASDHLRNLVLRHHLNETSDRHDLYLQTYRCLNRDLYPYGTSLSLRRQLALIHLKTFRYTSLN